MRRDITIGSAEHKELFCREFIDTHQSFDPNTMDWPDLDEDSLARLRAMPFWQEAVSTEQDVARKVQALAPRERDALVRDAIALQGYEEGRHAALLQRLIKQYDIQLPPQSPTEVSDNPEWDFIRVGYGECFDSFFAFGLYVMARDSGLFPAPLLHVVEPIVQEEARHILFFVNWIAYRRAHQSFARRPFDRGRCAVAMGLQVWTRLQTARGTRDDDFMLNVHDSLDLSLSPRSFLQLCVEEHERRLSAYDARLLRPRFVPAIAKTLCKVLR